jgi:hypothetical protein
MNHEVSFGSIESAQEFVTLFAQTVGETKCNVEGHLQTAINSNSSRRVEALEIVAYLLETLETDMKAAVGF